ncbi:MAG: hypothetical protein FJX84_03530 [Bacteroidetes bacterium]|nr:hypothetical protein [Bacteroidota bacterium]
MKFTLFIYIVLILASCNFEKNEGVGPKSAHPLVNYFYPYDSSARIYCYRNVTDGISEEFHRVYGYKDSKGYHIGVDILSPDGQRLIEAFVYNYDSLDVHLQMETISTGVPKPARIIKKNIFPWNEKSVGVFTSAYPSSQKSLEISQELNRTFLEKINSFLVISNEQRKAVSFKEVRKKRKYFKASNKIQNSDSLETISIFAEGFGLVEFYDKNKKIHFKLEKVITQ